MTLQEIDELIETWLQRMSITQYRDTCIRLAGDLHAAIMEHRYAAHMEMNAAKGLVDAIRTMMPTPTWYRYKDLDVKVDLSGNVWTRGARD